MLLKHSHVEFLLGKIQLSMEHNAFELKQIVPLLSISKTTALA